MRAVKGNKEYTIDETQQKEYQNSGFDILNDDGEVIAYGRGKTVAYDEYMKAVKEIGRLQQLAADQNAEIDLLKVNIAELRTTKQDSEKQEAAKKADTKKAGE